MKDLTKIEITLNHRPDLGGVTQILATITVAGKKWHWPALHDSTGRDAGEFTDNPTKALPGFVDRLLKTIL